jgi:hypothetical protein
MAKRNKLRKQLENNIENNWWKTDLSDYLFYKLLSISGWILVGLVYVGLFIKTEILALFTQTFFLQIHSVAISGILVFSIGNICLILMKNRGKTKMTCPRCIGKGFVDLNDIKRLGKEEDWIQGCCKYCDGNGEVIKGKTTLLSPIWTDDQIEDTEFDLWNYEEE